MRQPKSMQTSGLWNRQTNRRRFLATSLQALGGLAVAKAAAPRPGYVAESNLIRIALVGCGGRGTGATGQALSTKGPTQLWAMADVFDFRLQNSYKQLKQRFKDQVQVPPERQFLGFDAYRRAMDTLRKGDVVILTTPPAFRPIHLEYAVEKGLHVFMEKSFAVDAPGIRRVLRAGEKAKEKNLKIAGGLMSRHSPALEQAIDQIHQGKIGEVITVWAYRMHGPVGLVPRQPWMTELAYQIRNYSCFTWLNGSFIVDWLIHNIDVSCWVKGDWPASAQGMGGRIVRTVPDQLWDHYFAEYSFPDGTRMAVEGRHMERCWGFWGVVVLGTKGSAVLGEGIKHPLLFRGHQRRPEDVIWRYQGPPKNPYQVEHDLLFEAIRKDLPYNETDRCAKACLAAIMGRMACESGQLVTWDRAMQSNFELAPGLEKIKTLEDPAPVHPDAQGHYPIAKPGITRAL